jgi:hypothetical protein
VNNTNKTRPNTDSLAITTKKNNITRLSKAKPVKYNKITVNNTRLKNSKQIKKVISRKELRRRRTKTQKNSQTKPTIDSLV